MYFITAISIFLSIFNHVTSADTTAVATTTKEEFCQNLYPLESHLSSSFEELMEETFVSGFECSCKGADSTWFTVDCSMKGSSQQGFTFTSSESVEFRLKDGTSYYELTSTRWGWIDSDGLYSPIREVFNLDSDGAFSSCKATGCVDCTVCEDKKSFAVDCSNLEDGNGYTYTCDEEYTGSFSNTFNFGVITQAASTNEALTLNANGQKLDTDVCPQKFEAFETCRSSVEQDSNCLAEAAFGVSDFSEIDLEGLTCSALEAKNFCGHYTECIKSVLKECESEVNDYFDCFFEQNGCDNSCSGNEDGSGVVVEAAPTNGDEPSSANEQTNEEPLPETTTASPNSTTKEEFCNNLAPLEAHTTSSFEDFAEKKYTSSFECACRDQQDGGNVSFKVNCYMKGSDNGKAFAVSGRMEFELKGGVFEHTTTAWGYTGFDGVELKDQEVFYFDDGAVNTCKANGCLSCSLCDDKRSIEVDCSNLEGDYGYSYSCSEGYTGGFSNTFDFGVINDDASAAIAEDQATEATDVASVENNGFVERMYWMSLVLCIASTFLLTTL